MVSPACGIDEVGRGALAGPLIVASVIFKDYKNIPFNIKDSKQTTFFERKKAFRLITETADIGIGCVDAKIIDKIGISKATAVAAEKSILNNNGKKELFLLDGGIFLTHNYCLP